eukprot:scaffold2947_cov167-Skeletonema_menzelii.AAC.5
MSMKKKNSQPQPSRQSRSGRSVRFNLDQNTICDKGGAEYSLEADVYWYTNDQVRSMTIRTARNVETYRQWIAILRRMQDRTEQRRFLSAAVLGEGDEDEACIHGIENLVSKASLRRKIVRLKTQARRAVIEEQARQKLHGETNHARIALKSMRQSFPLMHRALQIARSHRKADCD